MRTLHKSQVFLLLLYVVYIEYTEDIADSNSII